ncbi:MAG: recombinase family protein [Actinomycetota bacterium]
MKIGYARVSTFDQNMFLQIDALERAGCEKVFTDTASGSIDTRKGLIDAIDFCRSGDSLIVWKLDRLGRSLRHLIDTMNHLQLKGVEFVSLQECVDTRTSGGKLVFHVFGALAEFEREMIRERTRAGLRSARDRGVVTGRPKKLTKAQIQMARTLMKNLENKPRDICFTMKISRSTLYRYCHPQTKKI